MFGKWVVPDTSAVLDQPASFPTVIEPLLRELVSRLTRARLFIPAALGPDDSIIAVQLFGS